MQRLPECCLSSQAPDWARRGTQGEQRWFSGAWEPHCSATLPFHTQGWSHSSGRMYTNNICAYPKEILNIKSHSARATSLPGGKSRVSAQLSLSASLPPVLQHARKTHMPTVTLFPNLILNLLSRVYSAFSLRSQPTISKQTSLAVRAERKEKHSFRRPKVS